ncbi:MAG TPA: 1-deoxy-D-xylulose-5-phosphate synthase [Erysipelotrichaceae bacterium]|nr:1-deoxy-D-xylulose-5-phosphate synthase [Erysipelotrichaceae bacterium]
MKKKAIRRFDLNKPFHPSDIKDLREEELELLSEDIRKNIIENCAKNGGHLASSLGATDLIVALHHYFDLPKDKIIFDVGHQAYAHKILSGRTLENLRKKNGVSGFQKREESVFDPYEAGHSSTSISAAMGMALARDLKGESYQVIAVIGDSSFSNGLAFEALNNLGSFKHKVIVIINDNNRSIGKAVGSTNNYFEKFRLSRSYLNLRKKYRALKKYRATRWFYRLTSGIKNYFKRLFVRKNLFSLSDIYFISNVDGHDFGALERVFGYAVNAPSSVVIHVTTTKGKGYAPAEKDVVGHWHGVEPFDIKTGKPLKKLDPKYTCWSGVYADLLKEKMASDPKMVLINPATMVGSKIDDLLESYPDRVFDVGISEEHGAVFAAGLAANGIHPYYSIYSTFLQRSYDQVSHDIARMDLNVTLLVDRVGLPEEDGETHAGIYDVAYLMSIPNVAIAMAKDQVEAKELFDFSIKYEHPLAIRYPRGQTLIMNNKKVKALKLGEWKLENKGKDIAIISYGPIVNELLTNYKDYTIINAVFLRPIDEPLLRTLKDYSHIVIYDIYGTKEGFASLVLNALNDLNYEGRLRVMALPNKFIAHGSAAEQLKDCQCTLDDLDKLVKKLK